MVTGTERIRISPDSELGRFLDAGGETPVLLERDGKLYRLVEEPDEGLWAGYDPNLARAALDRVTGSWADIDVDKLIAGLYRARDEGSRPVDRP